MRASASAVREGRARLLAVEACAVPDEQVLGLESPERIARGREAQEGWTPAGSRPHVKNRFVPTASATTSVRCSGHQSAISRQPRAVRTGTTPNGVPGSASGTSEVRDAELRCDRGAVAVVSVEQLDDGNRRAERHRALARRG